MIEEALLEAAQGGQKIKKGGLKLTDSQRDELVDKSMAEFLRFDMQLAVKKEQSLQMWQQYLQNMPDSTSEQFESPDESYESSSMVRSGVMAQAIDSVHAQQHMTSFPNEDKFYEGVPRNPLAKENQDKYEVSMQERISKIRFMIKTFNDRKNCMLDGVSAVAMPFRRDVKKTAVYKKPKIFDWIEIPLAPLKKTYEDKVVWEGTDFIPLALEEWAIDPTIDDLDETPFIYRYYTSPEKIKSIPQYLNTDEVENYQLYLDAPESRERIRLQYEGIDQNYSITNDKDGLGSNHAMIMERWGDFYVDGEFYENHVLVWSNASTFHYFGPNPYDHGKKPFSVAPYIPVPGTLYGKAVGVDCIHLVHAYDTFLNQLIDAVGKLANPACTYLDSDPTLNAYIGDDGLTLGAGDMIPVQQHDSIRQIEINLTNLEFIVNLRQNIKEEIREATGGVPYTTGGVDQGSQDRTLGEVEILANGTSTRFQSLIAFYEQMKLKPYIEQFFENDRQFMSEDVFLPQFESPLMADTVRQMDMDWSITGSHSSMAHNREISDLLQFMTTILPPLLQNGYAVPTGEVMEIDIPGFTLDMARMAKVKNADERIKVKKKPEEPMLPGAMPPAVGGQLNGLQAVLPPQGGGQGPILGGAGGLPPMAGTQGNIPGQGQAA